MTRAALYLMVALLTACGGGGGDDEPVMCDTQAFDSNGRPLPACLPSLMVQPDRGN